jgi:hypothetical protein
LRKNRPSLVKGRHDFVHGLNHYFYIQYYFEHFVLLTCLYVRVSIKTAPLPFVGAQQVLTGTTTRLLLPVLGRCSARGRPSPLVAVVALRFVDEKCKFLHGQPICNACMTYRIIMIITSAADIKASKRDEKKNIVSYESAKIVFFGLASVHRIIQRFCRSNVHRT